MLFRRKTANDLGLYDRAASSWWDPANHFSMLKAMNAPRFAYFDQFVSGGWQGKEVLDVGCGGGFTCEFMAGRGAKVTGVDRSAACIATAKEHAKGEGLTIEYVHGTGERLPVPDAKFDIVTCVDVLEHVEDLGQVLREVHRTLAPGGLFLFDTINRTFKSKVVMIWLMEDLVRKVPRGTHDWNMFIPPERLRDLLERDFQAVEFKGFQLGLSVFQKELNATIDDDLSVSYIGKAIKPATATAS